mmetsp:Transcript_137747/g.384111  ORF Transcript_137747/g.384111 Transcript_137747/m.384111 type:complete len:204 (-) Transcript_137747:70-681(-)
MQSAGRGRHTANAFAHDVLLQNWCTSTGPPPTVSSSEVPAPDRAYLIERPQLEADLALQEAHGHRPVVPRVVGGGTVVPLQPDVATRYQDLLAVRAIASQHAVARQAQDALADARVRVLRRGRYNHLTTAPTNVAEGEALEEQDVTGGVEHWHHRGTHSCGEVDAILLHAMQEADQLQPPHPEGPCRGQVGHQLLAPPPQQAG